ncbi:kiwellin-like [Prosopis cineraria]|uniref:kiwellin-like n=1 Tax=Prosopis cineraria TaxID=364024 RepID=UPI00240F293B|nr:kiwellin-like [Prosopis cineraria]
MLVQLIKKKPRGMGNFAILTLFLLFLAIIITDTEASSCNGPCETLDDCVGQLICINGKCDDDPQSDTQSCTNSNVDGNNCQSNGPYSPPYNLAGTRAILTVNDFGPGGDGSGPSECDKKFHPNGRVVALSTGWYHNRSRCFKNIRITANNGRSTVAKVVDECDSVNGCDKEHAYQPPCKNNIVDASDLVWKDLQLDTAEGEVAVTWTMAA